MLKLPRIKIHSRPLCRKKLLSQLIRAVSTVMLFYKIFAFQAIYLFGSFAKNKAHEWSDIDVAVISDKLKKNWDKNENLLWHARMNVDTMIQPIGFTIKDFQDECDPMAYEIKKTGIKIA